MEYKHLANQEDTVVFNPIKSLWLWLLIGLTLCFGIYALSWELALISATLTFCTICIGHSVGLHRGIIHKSYKTSKALRNVFAFLAVQTGMGGILSWLRHHYIRDYWQNREDCPPYLQYEHNMATDFFWNLHLTYVPSDWEKLGIPEEDLTDKYFIFLEKYWIGLVTLPALLTWYFWSFEAFIVLFPMRYLAGILGHWFIGFVCHKYGYAHYHIEGADNSGSNELVLGILSFGEGFHNNHHAHPSSARMGIKWYEFDLGWQVVKLFRAVGLIWEVKAEGETHTLKHSAIKIA